MRTVVIGSSSIARKFVVSRAAAKAVICSFTFLAALCLLLRVFAAFGHGDLLLNSRDGMLTVV